MNETAEYHQYLCKECEELFVIPLSAPKELDKVKIKCPTCHSNQLRLEKFERVEKMTTADMEARLLLVIDEMQDLADRIEKLEALWADEEDDVFYTAGEVH